MIDLADWDYELPDERIARRPADRRDASRLMVLPLVGGPPEHRVFSDLPTLLRPGDLLVVNDTRVMAARLRAKRQSGGAVELMLLEPGPGPVQALARPARKLRLGDVLRVGDLPVEVLENHGDGRVTVQFDRPVTEVMAAHGEMPLPPYLGRPADAADVDRYQTVYAGPLGAAAAPTAGLHFTPELLGTLRDRGIGLATVTLRVGLGTFLPLRPEQIAEGRLHAEPYEIPEATAAAIAATQGRVIAVGTTTARALEAATPEHTTLAGPGVTDLFVRPPYAFRAIDGLVTNFHLPGSSLLMLVAALVGRERLLGAYGVAVAEGYRFYSYGDAMLLV